MRRRWVDVFEIVGEGARAVYLRVPLGMREVRYSHYIGRCSMVSARGASHGTSINRRPTCERNAGSFGRNERADGGEWWVEVGTEFGLWRENMQTTRPATWRAAVRGVRDVGPRVAKKSMKRMGVGVEVDAWERSVIAEYRRRRLSEATPGVWKRGNSLDGYVGEVRGGGW